MALEYVLAITLAYSGASGIQQSRAVNGSFATNAECLQAITAAQEQIKREDPRAMVVVGGGTLCRPQETVAESEENRRYRESTRETLRAARLKVWAEEDRLEAERKKAQEAKTTAK